MSFTILALGDSIVWGQGLLENQKFVHLVRGSVAAMFPNTKVELRSYAHSGATIARTSMDYRAYWGEAPFAHPSIQAQLDLAKSQLSRTRDTVYLVLLDGGINDVTIERILTLDPTIADKNQWIRGLVAKRIADPASGAGPMRTLAADVLAAFPNAVVVVTGYFQIVSPRSAIQSVAAALAAYLSVAPYGVVGAAVNAAVIAFAFQGLIAQSATFQDAANKALAGAVASVNSTLPSPRVFFADPGFGPEHAMSADQTRLFDGHNDPMFWERNQRYLSDPLRYSPLTPIASLAHPNVEGARMYWSAIMNHLRALGPRFGPVAPSPECAQIKASINEKRVTLAVLNESKSQMNPRTDRLEILEINGQITALQGEIATLEQRSQSLGCP